MAEDFEDFENFGQDSRNDSEDSVSSQESDYDPGLGTNFKNVHQVITAERRKLFVSLINEEGISIAKASRKFGLRYSTAKTIYAQSKKRKLKVSEEKEKPEDAMTHRSKRKPKKNGKDVQMERESPLASRKKKGYQKVEPNWRAEAPVTRKKVKIAEDNSKDAFTCKVKLIPTSNNTVIGPTENDKFREINIKTEVKMEADIDHFIKMEHLKPEAEQIKLKIEHPAESLLSMHNCPAKTEEKINLQNLSRQNSLTNPTSLDSLFQEFQRRNEELRAFPNVFHRVSNMINLMSYLSSQMFSQTGLNSIH